MTKIGRSIVVALALGAFVTGLSGCKKEGPAERTGREIDESAKKAGKEIEKSAKKVGKEIEKVGEKMKDAVKDLKK